MKREDKQIIFEWSQYIEEMTKQGLKPSNYCRINNLNFTKFLKMIHRIHYKKYKDPDKYNQLLPLGHEYLNSSLTAKQVAEKSGATLEEIKDISLHIKYCAIIDQIKNNSQQQPSLPKETNEMKFIQIQNQKNFQPLPQEAEVVTAKNEIELIIKKGVRVILSEEIEPMKFIKIIELLKEI